MTDVFISYSRKDKAFVQVLNQALVESKYDAWVDWENIPLTADWWEEIKAGIEGADTFVCVISPDSITTAIKLLNNQALVSGQPKPKLGLTLSRQETIRLSLESRKDRKHQPHGT